MLLLTLLLLCIKQTSEVLETSEVLADAGAYEAILPDGRHLLGKLSVVENSIQFVPAGQQAALPLEKLHQVRFPERPGPVCLGGAFHHVAFADGQRLTGELIALDGQTLRLRPPWRGSLAIPRQAVRALTQPAGYLSVLEEDFESDLGSWKVKGAAALDARQHLSGRQSLLINGGEAELTVAQPLGSGRAEVNFYDDGIARGARWVVILHFQHGPQTWPLRIVVGGDTHYRMYAGGTPGEVGRLARSGGWHRLVVDFAPEFACVSVDDQVLWTGRPERATVLTRIQLASVALPDKGPVAGGVWFDDFALARAVEDLRHEDADPRQDEVWLASGDQLLGHVLKADRRGINLEGRFGKRTLPWSDVRGLYLRQASAPLPKGEPARTRVWLHAAGGGDLDQLVGQLLALTASRLTLRHALLGDLEIERIWLRRIAPVSGEPGA